MNYCTNSYSTAFPPKHVGYDVAVVALDNMLALYSPNTTIYFLIVAWYNFHVAMCSWSDPITMKIRVYNAKSSIKQITVLIFILSFIKGYLIYEFFSQMARRKKMVHESV
jgi:hypothetical protein